MQPDEVPWHVMERVKQLEKEDRSEQPCCSKSLETPSCSKQKEIKSEPNIPVVPFGRLDFKYWGERRRGAPIPRNNADCHRFWRSLDDDDRPAINEKEASLGEERLITWIGEPQRAEKRCKARLSNGKLCPRMDLRKCPLHGLIVDRDDEGFPLVEMDEIEMAAAQAEQDHHEEQEYLRDLEAATGKSFVSKPKKTKKKKVKESTVRERLEQDDATSHTARATMGLLHERFEGKVTSRGGDINWPPRSCDLTPLDYFLWGFFLNRRSTQTNHKTLMTSMSTYATPS
ncbi:hypothetical protein GCK32_008868, partial [Trichostrongylus colubriformis]